MLRFTSPALAAFAATLYVAVGLRSEHHPVWWHEHSVSSAEKIQELDQPGGGRSHSSGQQGRAARCRSTGKDAQRAGFDHQAGLAGRQRKRLPSAARAVGEQPHACMRRLAAASRLASRLPSGLLHPSEQDLRGERRRHLRIGERSRGDASRF